MTRRRSVHSQMISTVFLTFAFLWSVILALVAIGGLFWLSIVLSILGGTGLAWLRAHV